MAEIYRFLGIVITMYTLDAEHNPPHINARYAEYHAEFDIRSMNLIAGDMPSKKIEQIKEFIEYHKDELMKMWEEQHFYRIED